MCSTENQNYLATSKMLSDTIVSFKPNSELKKYIHQKTRINKTFFTLGEITAILKVIIGQEKQYDKRNPAVIICSEELKLALKCEALHVTELRHNYKSFSFCFWVSGGSKEPQKLFSNKQVFCHSCLDTQKGPVQTKNSFLWTNPKCKKANKGRTIFTYEEICSSLSKYIIDQRAQFFHGKNFKIAWVHDDLLGVCFNVSAFHVTQVKTFLWSQLIPVQTRKSSRLVNKR